jgi:hypothetical protein
VNKECWPGPERQAASTDGAAARALSASQRLREELLNAKFDCLPNPNTSDGLEEHAKEQQQLLAIVFSSPAASSRCRAQTLT